MFAQNPISPFGVYIADPSARVMPDGKLYIYGSKDENRKDYCSKGYHVLSIYVMYFLPILIMQQI